MLHNIANLVLDAMLVNILVSVDDIVSLSPSWKGLYLIDSLFIYALKLDIRL